MAIGKPATTAAAAVLTTRVLRTTDCPSAENVRSGSVDDEATSATATAALLLSGRERLLCGVDLLLEADDL